MWLCAAGQQTTDTNTKWKLFPSVSYCDGTDRYYLNRPIAYYTSEPRLCICSGSQPIHLNRIVHTEFDPGMVGKGVLVCYMTSLRKWSIGCFLLGHILPEHQQTAFFSSTFQPRLPWSLSRSFEKKKMSTSQVLRYKKYKTTCNLGKEKWYGKTFNLQTQSMCSVLWALRADGAEKDTRAKTTINKRGKNGFTRFHNKKKTAHWII